MTRGELKFGGNTVKVWLEIEDGEVRASSVRPKQGVHFHEFAGKYESEILPSMKPASQASVKSVIGILVRAFGARKLSEVGTEEIQKFITASEYSPKSLKNQIGVFRMVWNKARAWGYVKHNPFEFLSLPRQPLAEARTLSVEDARAIIRKTDEPFKTMLWVLAETGVRGGELCGLYKSDLDGRVLRIARSAFRKQIQTPKTVSAVREIHISGQLARHLNNLNSVQHNNLIFAMPDGRPWDGGEIVRRLKSVLGAGIGLHAFRHANASLMASLGVPEHIRRERLGHSSGNVTARYTHSLPEDHQRWAEEIGRACTENVQSLAMGAD